MINAEFQKKLAVMTKEWLPIVSKQMTVNELIWILRHDKDVEDYNLNINSESQGFSFGLLKESFTPTRILALQITSIEYEEDDCEDEEMRSPYPCLVVKTN
jgi:hypothetical protein